jgi:predicted MPP superfamily phosphohydrolase
LERIGGLAALGATGTLFGWGMTRGRHDFVTEEVVVKVRGLPRALEGYTLAQLSDIHTGVFMGEDELRVALDRAGAFRPDLLVLTGDLIDNDAAFAPVLARALRGFQARDGIAGILGNHDYFARAEEVVKTMRAAGVDMLVNDGRRVRAADGGGFGLVGLDDLSAGRYGGRGPDLRLARLTLPPDLPLIALAHQPRCFEWLRGSVELQLSGHTHGGQIKIGVSPADIFYGKYVRGRYEAAGSTLWVNRGIGVVGPPARINAPPEVTKIVLVAG